VITQQVVLGEGPLIGVELDMDLTDEAGASKVSQLTTPLRLRLLEGTGTVLGRLEGDGLARTTHRDIFDAAELASAGTTLVKRYLRTGPGSAAPLPVGRCSYVDGEVKVPLRASGFDRHTFLCGQSGSGKTFSLGVMLEQLLLQTDLRLVVLDPNSDFVALGTLRDGEGIDDRLAGRYRAATSSLRVARSPGHAGQAGSDVRIRFSDLTRAEQAEVLQLDPLAACEEFSAFWQLVERLGRQRYSLTEVERLVLGELSAEARQLGLRIANLDVAGWEVWCEPEAPSLVDLPDGDDNVVSQCDNLVLMRLSSNADLAYLAEVFSQVPASLLGRAPHFTIGQALIAGRPVQSPTFVTFGRRLSRDGGSDIPATWATRPGQRSGGG
jgi:DNA helicase HerA-like ATPase